MCCDRPVLGEKIDQNTIFPALPAGRKPPKKPTNNGFDKPAIKGKSTLLAVLVPSCSHGWTRLELWIGSKWKEVLRHWVL